MTTGKGDVVGVLLAGGRARRMGGGDKCLLEIGGKSLLARAIGRLSPQVSELVINANGDEDRFGSFEHPIVRDTVEGFVGPLAGVLAGMRWAELRAPDARFILTVAPDTPFFPRDLTHQFIEAIGGRELAIVLATSNGRVHPVCGLWPVALADNLEDVLKSGMRRMLDWTAMLEVIEVPFEIHENGSEQIDPFFNVNRPEDLARAEILAKSLS